MQFLFAPNLKRIAAKIEANERLTFAENIELYKTADLDALGKLANFARRFLIK